MTHSISIEPTGGGSTSVPGKNIVLSTHKYLLQPLATSSFEKNIKFTPYFHLYLYLRVPT